MTKNAIITILEELNTTYSKGGDLYVPGIWLEAEEIATISTQDEKAIWPDDTMQVRFDIENEVLETRRGETGADGVFKPASLHLRIKFQEIVAITLVSSSVKKSAYRFGNTL